MDILKNSTNIYSNSKIYTRWDTRFTWVCIAMKQTVNTNSRWRLMHSSGEQTSSPSCGGVNCPFGPGVQPGPHCESVCNVKSCSALEARKRSPLDCIILIDLRLQSGGRNCVYLSVPQMPSLWDATLLRQVRYDGTGIARPESEVQQAVGASFRHPIIGFDHYNKLFFVC